MRKLIPTTIAAVLCMATTHANEQLTGIACRSVHLQYTAEPATAFYNEGRVTDSSPGSYFMMNGWNGGYFGIQELADKRKVVLFSLWDSNQTHDPKALEESKRTKVVSQAPDVRVGRFGGEGTGGQSFFDYDWKPNVTYRFLVHVRPAGDGRAEYSGFFYLPESKTWKHLVTFSSPLAPKALRGPHSFVEDFLRNRTSTESVRRAEYGNTCVRVLDGSWKPITTATFTADSNKSVNIDSNVKDGHFFLATGGTTTNAGKKLWEKFTNPDAAKSTVPADVVKLLADFEKPASSPKP